MSFWDGMTAGFNKGVDLGIDNRRENEKNKLEQERLGIYKSQEARAQKAFEANEGRAQAQESRAQDLYDRNKTDYETEKADIEKAKAISKTFNSYGSMVTSDDPKQVAQGLQQYMNLYNGLVDDGQTATIIYRGSPEMGQEMFTSNPSMDGYNIAIALEDKDGNMSQIPFKDGREFQEFVAGSLGEDSLVQMFKSKREEVNRLNNEARPFKGEDGENYIERYNNVNGMMKKEVVPYDGVMEDTGDRDYNKSLPGVVKGKNGNAVILQFNAKGQKREIDTGYKYEDVVQGDKGKLWTPMSDNERRVRMDTIMKLAGEMPLEYNDLTGEFTSDPDNPLTAEQVEKLKRLAYDQGLAIQINHDDESGKSHIAIYEAAPGAGGEDGGNPNRVGKGALEGTKKAEEKKPPKKEAPPEKEERAPGIPGGLFKEVVNKLFVAGYNSEELARLEKLANRKHLPSGRGAGY